MTQLDDRAHLLPISFVTPAENEVSMPASPIPGIPKVALNPTDAAKAVVSSDTSVSRAAVRKGGH